MGAVASTTDLKSVEGPKTTAQNERYDIVDVVVELCMRNADQGDENGSSFAGDGGLSVQASNP